MYERTYIERMGKTDGFTHMCFYPGSGSLANGFTHMNKYSSMPVKKNASPWPGALVMPYILCDMTRGYNDRLITDTSNDLVMANSFSCY